MNTNGPRNGSSRTAAKFVVRMPDGMRERIKERAFDDGLAMNGWVVKQLERVLDGGRTPWFPTEGQAVTCINDDSIWVIKMIYGTVADVRFTVTDRTGRYGDRKDACIADYLPLHYTV